MGGPRGSDLGTLVGMAAGTAIGASTGAAAERDRQIAYEERVARRQAAREARERRDYDRSQYQQQDESGYTQNGTYDDRLFDFGSGENGGSTISTVTPAASVASLQILNARFVDENHNSYLAPNEQAKVVFEIKNTGTTPAYDVLPMVAETTGNRHIQISDNVHIECIQPGATMRYAAMVLCDSRIKTGEVCFSVNVRYNNKEIGAPKFFRVPVRK